MKQHTILAALAALLSFGTAHAYQYPGTKTLVASGAGLPRANVSGGQMFVAHARGTIHHPPNSGLVNVFLVKPVEPLTGPGDVAAFVLALDIVGSQLHALVKRDVISGSDATVNISYPVTDPLSPTLTPFPGDNYNIDLWLYLTPYGGWIENVAGPSALAQVYVTPLFFGYANAAKASAPSQAYSVNFSVSSNSNLNEVYIASPTQMPCVQAPCEPFQYFADILTGQFAQAKPQAPFFFSGNAQRAAALVISLD